MPATVLGGGANVLIADAGIRGLTIINRATEIEQSHHEDGVQVSVSSGASLIRLTRYCHEHGAWRHGMGDWRARQRWRGGGQQCRRPWQRYCEFPDAKPRSTKLAGSGAGWMPTLWNTPIVTPGSSRGKIADSSSCEPTSALRAMSRPRSWRAWMTTTPTAAKRSRLAPAWAASSRIRRAIMRARLIEAAGLKGQSLGRGAGLAKTCQLLCQPQRGCPAPADYLALIALVRERVAARFGIWLELEISDLGRMVEISALCRLPRYFER